MICVRNRGLLSLWLFHLGAKIESGWLSKVSTRSGLCKDCFLLKKLCAVPNNEFDNLEWTSRAHRVNQPFAQLQSYVVFFECVCFFSVRECVSVYNLYSEVCLCVCETEFCWISTLDARALFLISFVSFFNFLLSFFVCSLPGNKCKNITSRIYQHIGAQSVFLSFLSVCLSQVFSVDYMIAGGCIFSCFLSPSLVKCLGWNLVFGARLLSESSLVLARQKCCCCSTRSSLNRRLGERHTQVVRLAQLVVVHFLECKNHTLAFV